MGVFADGCIRCDAFHPTLTDMASILGAWNPRTDDPDAHDLPNSDGFSLAPTDGYAGHGQPD